MCVCVPVCLWLTEDGAVAALHKGSKSGAGWDEWEPELGPTQVTSAPSEGTLPSNLGAAGTLQRRTEDGMGDSTARDNPGCLAFHWDLA